MPYTRLEIGWSPKTSWQIPNHLAIGWGFANSRNIPFLGTLRKSFHETPAKMNRLYYGDNLEILRKHIKDEVVDLCYVDPPFNSKRNYNQIYNNVGKEDAAQAQAFVDTWNWDSLAINGFKEIIENSRGIFAKQTTDLLIGLNYVLGASSLLAYLISMTLRIAEIHRVLKPTGSFYLHCDPTSSHYLKLVLDSVFCSQGGDYKNELIWKRSSAHNDAKQGRKAYGNVSDTVLYYTKSDQYTFNTQYSSYSQKYLDTSYKNTDPDGRKWKSSDITGPGGAAKGNPSYEFLGVVRYWRYSKENMENLYQEGRIYQARPGAVPRMKHYLDEMPGVAVQNIWDDIAPLSSHARERLGYPTQKPEALLERIIQASSNQGDVILDAYCGCGTTVAVAQKLDRQWIGVDITYQSISLILKRLEDTHGAQVVDSSSLKLTGIPKDIKSAEALAVKSDDRLRKEFEKWAVLTYSNNRAAINQKKGADQGIDGWGFFPITDKTFGRVIFQVKSGKVSSKDIRDLSGTISREQAELGVFLTLKPPTQAMVKEAKACGLYRSETFRTDVPRIQIVTIEEMLEGKARLGLPLVAGVLKSSARHIESEGEQLELDAAV